MKQTKHKNKPQKFFSGIIACLLLSALMTNTTIAGVRMQTYTYKRVGELEIKANVYRADDEKVRPVIVWIHGGALIMGGRDGINRRVKKMFLDAGYTIVSIDYRLAPETKLPAIIEDVEDAFKWIREKGPELFDIDASKIAVLGGSAGGYLTLTTGHRVKPHPTVLVAFWGYGDLIGDWYSKPSPHPRHQRSKMTEEQVRRQVSGPPIANSKDRNGNGGAFYQYCRQQGIWPKEVTGWDPHKEAKKFYPYMPVKNVSKEYPPTLLIHGTKDTDVPYEQSVMMAEQFRKFNVNHEFITIAGGEHGLGGGDPEKIDEAYKKVFQFVHQKVLASSEVQKDSADIVFNVKRKVTHKINPRIFGQFMERPSWGEIGVEGGLIPGTRKLQSGVLKLLREMEIPVIRFPGGTDVDFMDWQDMVDNIPNRTPERPITIGHRGHKVTNNFGYDEFLHFCEDTGAEAIVVVNFRDGLLKKKSLRQAAMHAAALVAYCNAPVGAKLPDGMYDWPALRAKNGRVKPYKVKYFQIGNETWAFIRELKKMIPDKAPQFYAKCLNSYIEAMRAVDPSIEIIIDGHDGNMSGIFKEVYKQTADKVSYFATHFYTPWSITKIVKNREEASVSELSPEEIWRAWVAVTWFDDSGQSVINHPGINAARKDGYKVAVTEWNWNGRWRLSGPAPALNSSFAKGLGAAGYLHAFMRVADVIELGCQSMLVGNSWGIHAIKADAEAKIPPFYMPTGQVTMFYSKHHGENLIKVESSGVPVYQQPYRMGGIRPEKKVAYIDALATADEKSVYFHAINRNFNEPIDVTIDISAFSRLQGRAIHHVLQGRLNDAPKPNENRQIGRITHRDIFFEGKKLKITLPKRSVSCIEFMQN